MTGRDIMHAGKNGLSLREIIEQLHAVDTADFDNEAEMLSALRKARS
ncbi:hypothetical protein [Halalkalicoccus tibetensis]|uniref:Uncharacterized protein n=1 Tax=Halalkalicoccus tibetensis TaxID=175632 RepID=A0ABD5V7P0_9EURY